MKIVQNPGILEISEDQESDLWRRPSDMTNAILVVNTLLTMEGEDKILIHLCFNGFIALFSKFQYPIHMLQYLIIISTYY